MDELTALKVRGITHDACSCSWEGLLEHIDDNISLAGYYNAQTVEEAVHLLGLYHNKGARLISGGTDILRLIRNRYQKDVPQVLIRLAKYQDLAGITLDKGVLKVGAFITLADIEISPLVTENCGILAQAAGSVGSPQLRNMATLAGSICQDVNCWYYRASKGYYHCWRKGGEACPARSGDNRWMFSIFHTDDCNCYASCQSDMAVTLTALKASVVTTQRIIPVEQFFTVTYPGTVLRQDEIILAIHIPVLNAGMKGIYTKYRIRKSIDHALVSVAGTIIKGKLHLALGGVSATPYVPETALEYLNRGVITAQGWEQAEKMLVADARPLAGNSWKLPVLQALARRTVQELLDKA